MHKVRAMSNVSESHADKTLRYHLAFVRCCAEQGRKAHSYFIHLLPRGQGETECHVVLWMLLPAFPEERGNI